MSFHHFDTAAFLRDHWQKAPLLIRNPWAHWTNPIDGDELAGLACEEGIEARLVSAARGGLKVEHGPFSGACLNRLGKSGWTLLVQAVDHHVPEVSALIEPFRFIPDWRIDDVMVSYAADGGGVGPHFDQYDVFLIQGAGRRLWRIGQYCDGDTALLPHDDLRLLADFQVTQEWLLEPGDILYVPPGIAHDGIAAGDGCMTYSVGFRAPATGELLEAWAEHLAEEAVGDGRYADPDLAPQPNPGEIVPEAIDRLHAMLTAAVGDRAAFARWFGEYSTASKYPEMDWAPEEAVDRQALRAALAAGAAMRRNPASRFAYVEQADGLSLFVDGDCFDCAGDGALLARQLCAYAVFAVDPVLIAAGDVMTLLVALFDRGAIALDETV